MNSASFVVNLRRGKGLPPVAQPLTTGLVKQGMTSWLTRLFRRTADRTLDSELRDHLEHLVGEFRAAGLNETEARRRAVLRLGGIEQLKEELRDARPMSWVGHTVRDITFLVRQIRRQPGFWAIIVATLVLGTATSASVFAIVNGVLLRPLPYFEADRLVSVVRLSYKGEFLHLDQHSETMSVGAFNPVQAISLTGEGEPVRLQAARANAALFEVLRVEPLWGRRLQAADTIKGAAPVAILGHGLWLRRFGGRSDVIGTALVLDGVTHTVVGVMPASFRYPAEAELWLPLTIDPGDRIALWSTGARMIGRLKGAHTVTAAASEVRTMMPAIREQFPWKMPAAYGQTATVAPLQDDIVGDVRAPLLSLLASVLVVMLIVCANVASLLLALGFAREREFAIRVAVGATRARLVRQLLLESGFVAFVAGLAGTLGAAALITAALPFLPPDLPRADEIGLDLRVLGFALAVSVVSGLLFGLVPALRATAAVRDLAPLRASGGTTLQAPERRLGRGLAIAEFALASLLVVTAALLAGNLLTLLAVDPGFRPERLATATVVPLKARYNTPALRGQFASDATARLRNLPGITAAAAGSVVPFGAGIFGSVFSIEGRPDPAVSGDWPGADVRAAVSDDYLSVLAVPTLEGRTFTSADTATSPKTAVVSSALAKRFWGSDSPIGARIRFPGAASWITIVGIVGDLKWRSLGRERNFNAQDVEWLGAIYLPLAQNDTDVVRLIVRTDRTPQQLTANLRRLVASLDPDAPVSDIATLDDRIAASAARPRFTATLLSFFAGVALFLGAIGVYGVLAYAVRRRRQEFAVRMAVGGTARHILGGVVAEGMSLTIVGIALGLAGSFAATRFASQLFTNLTARDVTVTVAVTCVLAAIGFLASYVPAVRATRVNPVTALRN